MSIMTTPDYLSIVILTFNRKRMLESCVHSLLNQDVSRERYELIVVDDGSTDGTDVVTESLGKTANNLKYVYQRHLGIPAARNSGIAAAKGNLIAFVADDYVLPNNYVSTIFDFFAQNPAAKIVRFNVVSTGNDLSSRVGGLYYEVSLRNRMFPRLDGTVQSRWFRLKKALSKLPPEPPCIITDHLLEPSGGAAFKKEVFEKVGTFREHLKRAEDTELRDRIYEAQIEIHYNPFLKIEHHLGPFYKMLLKQFDAGYQYGIYSYLRNKKARPEKPTMKRVLRRFKRMAGSFVEYAGMAFLRPIWRSIQAKSISESVFVFPFMCLMDWVHILGFFTGNLIFNPYRHSLLAELLLGFFVFPFKLTSFISKRTKFLIFTHGRTGSEIVRTILNAHPEIVCYGEMLNMQRRHFPFSYVQNKLDFPFLSKKVRAAGFKLRLYNIYVGKFHQFLPDAPELVRSFLKDGYKLIYLRRKNLLREALSVRIANQRRIWAEKGVNSFKGKKWTVDCEKMLRIVSNLERFKEMDEALAKEAGHHLELVYEDDLLCADQHQGTADRLFSFLGVASVPVQITSLKITPSRISEFIENYEELYTLFSEQGFAKYLDEDDVPRSFEQRDGRTPSGQT